MNNPLILFARCSHKLVTNSLFLKCRVPKLTTCSVHTTGKEPNQQEVLVYRGPLNRRIKVVKLLSLSSSIVGVGFLYLILKDLSQVSLLLTGGATVISSFFLSTPLMLNFITKRYVLQLNFNQETKLFTAKTFNLLTQEKELQFSASDVFVPDLPGFLSSFQVRGVPLFVDARLVEDPDAYSHMMGYDKPFDLTLPSEDPKKL